MSALELGDYNVLPGSSCSMASFLLDSTGKENIFSVFKNVHRGTPEVEACHLKMEGGNVC